MSGNSTCKPTQTGENRPNETEFFSRGMKVLNSLGDIHGSDPFMIASCYDGNTKLVSSSSSDGWQSRQVDEAAFIEDVHEQMHTASHIFIMGHSYGGWLAMKLLENWDGDPGVVDTVDTIDPISKVNCTISRPVGCTSFPQDVKQPQRVRIAEASKIWVNTWQNNTFYLHSSPIKEADVNREVKELDHHTVATDDNLWKDIEQRAKRISSEG
jgi:pimeloyl-ACP methyl ester carboxylesterase